MMIALTGTTRERNATEQHEAQYEDDREDHPYSVIGDVEPIEVSCRLAGYQGGRWRPFEGRGDMLISEAFDGGNGCLAGDISARDGH